MANIDLRLGDCFEGLKSIPDHSIDCIVTDPPWMATNLKFDNGLDEMTMMAELLRVTKPKRAIAIFGNLRSAIRIITLYPKEYHYDWIWVKKRPVGFYDSWRQPLRKHELVLIFSSGGMPLYNPQFTYDKPLKGHAGGNMIQYNPNTPKFFRGSPDGRRHPSDVLQISNTTYKAVHPTQKPADLCEYLIRTYSNAGDVILDPFAGSGTTAVAAINSDRSFIGWERDEGYYNAAVKRIGTAKITKAETLPIDYD